MSKNGELVIDKHVLICFSIGKYVDEILFDVVPMEASHLLLGRPWKYDRDVVHNGVTNKFSFVHKGQKVTLRPLSPSEVCEDQIKNESEKRTREKKRQKYMEESGQNAMKHRLVLWTRKVELPTFDRSIEGRTDLKDNSF